MFGYSLPSEIIAKLLTPLNFLRSRRENKNITIGDVAYTLFLNTKGRLKDVSPELKIFLDFIGKNKVSYDSFIEILIDSE